MRKPYCCDASRAYYIDYYKRQSQGGGDIPVFHGARMQRGHGLGSILGGLFRRVLPFLKSGAEMVGKQALRSVGRVADDVINKGIPLREAASGRFREGIREFVNDTGIIQQSGSGVRGRKRKRITQKLRKSKKTKKSRKRQRLNVDIFQ